ncbi:MAG: paraquat-inducible protein A [Terrimicrobiaceae bacterium]|nr:paraquat-inducible protein A [Terrimicrobiaceae bacterium]
MAEDRWLSCRVCNAPLLDRELRDRQELRCGRCGSSVRRPDRSHLLHAAWAVATTGLVLCVLANVYPILTFEVAGDQQSTRIISGVRALVAQGFWPVAALVFFCAVLAPVLHFASAWYLAGSMSRGGKWPMTRLAQTMALHLGPWSLIPVFAVACVVAVVKLDMLGHVTWNLGMLWVGLLAVCSFALSRILDLEETEPHHD